MGEGGGGSSSGFINPGIGILKSWQGIVEIVLRGGAVVSFLIRYDISDGLLVYGGN